MELSTPKFSHSFNCKVPYIRRLPTQYARIPLQLKTDYQFNYMGEVHKIIKKKLSFILTREYKVKVFNNSCGPRVVHHCFTRTSRHRSTNTTQSVPPILTSLLVPESRDKVVKIPCNYKALVTRKLVTPAVLN